MSGKKCAIYARVSSTEQIRGQSVEGQIEMGRKYAADREWPVVTVYTDAGYSAKTDNRPDFQRMLSDALAGQFEVIILESFDRFARNLEDAVTHKSILRSNGVEIVSIMEPLDRDNPASLIQEGIADLFAAYYSANLSAKTSRGKKRAAERGDWPGRTPPLGYERRVEAHGSWIEVSEAGAKIAWAFTEFATGNYTLKSFVPVAYQHGLRSVSGRKLDRTALHKILTSKFYIGVMKWSGQEYQGNHEPIVEAETWQAVQSVLAANNDGKKQRIRRRYLLGGLLWSDDVGSKMIGTYGRSATGREYRYYRGTQKTTAGQNHTTPADGLESQIVAALGRVTIPTEAIGDLSLNDPAIALALRVAPDVGTLYPHLDTYDQRRALLEMVVARFHVSGDSIVGIEVYSPFSSDWFELDSVLMPTEGLEPEFYLWSIPCEYFAPSFY